VPLRFFEWTFRNERTEAICLSDPEALFVAIAADLCPEAKRARELEALGYYESGQHFGRMGKVCHVATRAQNVDGEAVLALKRVVEREEPGWIERVRKTWTSYGDAESVSLWTGLPLQVVVAIHELLDERGAQVAAGD
jgi:hypothetical protein